MTAIDALDLVARLLFVAASLVAVRLCVRHRSDATALMAATFLLFDVVLVVGALVPDPAPAASRALVAAMLLAPYLLLRFADAVTPGPRALRRAGGVLTAACLLPVPWLAVEEGAATGIETAWLVVALADWVGCLLAAGWLLVRAARPRTGVVRSRLRTLAAATVGLGLVVPLVAVAGDRDSTAVAAGGALLTTAVALAFLVGMRPPRLLRAAWRQPDERALAEASARLIAARDVAEVTDVLVPGVADVFGSPHIVLRGPDGHVVGQAGHGHLAPVRRVTRTVGDHELEMATTRAMPEFGSDEAELLDRYALVGALALERVRLVAAERDARAEVERVNAELEAFVSTTSHDLKNPVIALIGYLALIREDHADELSPTLLEHLERMDVNVRHMDALIHDLLALSRVGRVDAQPEVVDLELVVDDVAGDLRRRHPDVTVSRGALPAVWCNPTRARQLVANLLDNAVAYGGRPDVTVRVRAGDGPLGARVVVRDDGRGIPDDALERVFGVFERLDPHRGDGTGMGLAICRRIVEHAGGRIVALPDPDGAVFQVDLPVPPHDPDTPERAALAATPPTLAPTP